MATTAIRKAGSRMAKEVKTVTAARRKQLLPPNHSLIKKIQTPHPKPRIRLPIHDSPFNTKLSQFTDFFLKRKRLRRKKKKCFLKIFQLHDRIFFPDRKLYQPRP